MKHDKNRQLNAYQGRKRVSPNRLFRIAVGIGLPAMLSISCSLVTNLLAPTDIPPTAEAPDFPQEAQPTAIVVDSPVPPTPEPPTPEPPTAMPPTTAPTATPDPWLTVAGTWSGCLPGSPGGLVTLDACSQPRGSFITLYLLSSCSPGEICGSYVKGTFDSEYILLHLSLEQTQGSQVQMHAEAASDMFSWATTEVVLERTGNALQIAEDAGESYLLPAGCDPVIDLNVTIQCHEHVP